MSRTALVLGAAEKCTYRMRRSKLREANRARDAAIVFILDPEEALGDEVIKVIREIFKLLFYLCNICHSEPAPVSTGNASSELTAPI